MFKWSNYKINGEKLLISNTGILTSKKFTSKTVSSNSNLISNWMIWGCGVGCGGCVCVGCGGDC